ncbi:MAG TPA: hypothetical protein VMT46_18835 [Anaerolineaceae bacterium]|nr:hypothetical protein [Anaerolineaceae bacterium]
MDARTIETINKQIYRRFPEVDGAAPKVQAQPGASEACPNFLLTYKGSVTLEGGKKMPRIVRVVASDRGKIIKVTTSR